MRKYISLLILVIVTLSCKEEKQKTKIVNKNSTNNYDTTKGYFVEYPSIIKEGYLEINKNGNYNITLNKILTKDDTKYELEFYDVKREKTNFEVPIKLGVALDDIDLVNNIDSEFEKEFGKSKESKFVVKFYNGNAPTLWNYEFTINNKNEIYLKNIFFYCNIKKMMEIKGVKDTVAQFIKFPINQNVNKLNTEKIYSINMFEDWNKIEKIEKWRLE
ncbi:MAG: hypothetical protein ABIP69_05920 [Ferruginibacter sp.]